MPGSPTTPGRSDTRAIVSDRIAFRVVDRVGTQDIPNYAAQWLAYAHPCRRFACILAVADARLGAVAGHYSFNVADFHRLLLASLLAHRQSGWYGIHLDCLCNTLLQWCHGNVVGKADRRGNLYPTKQRPEQKIDAAVALMMAIGRAMIEDEDPKGLEGFLTNPIFG